ncbi:ribose 5-phosphate isomerase B [Candidatus Woesearchaeota archaeon]|nr:ribose 5-phosphate isomerase B [Candidatus Woesearchaeota archaeon]
MKIFIGADHAGFKLKEDIIKYLKTLKISFDDLGTSSDERVDYPDFAFKVAGAVAKNKNARGILICGTGTGMVIAANKVRGIRAALIYDDYTARMAREHNDANIACLRGRKFPVKKALKILKVWLKTSFSRELRHKQRLEKVSKYEEKFHACLP